MKSIILFILAMISIPTLGVHIQDAESYENIIIPQYNYNLLIITPSEFLIELQPLIPHKESHGIRTIIVTLDKIYN